MTLLFRKKYYKCVLFDLDRTLWDLETNADKTLNDLYVKYNLSAFIPVYADFAREYSKINNRLWAEYTAGNIKKERLRILRFYKTLKFFGVDNADLGRKMDSDYVAICPTKAELFPYTKEVLNYLSPKYTLYIVTNGFNGIQDQKLEHSKIDHYFGKIFTSEDVGYAKPDVRIFQHIMKELQVSAEECIMIGDDWEADICGAMNVGIDQIYFNPKGVELQAKPAPTHEIACLSKIKSIL